MRITAAFMLANFASAVVGITAASMCLSALGCTDPFRGNDDIIFGAGMAFLVIYIQAQHKP